MLHTHKIADRMEGIGLPRPQAEAIARAYAQALNQSSASSTHLFDTLACYETLIGGGVAEPLARALTHGFQDVCQELFGGG
jgi:hypothetical protein